MDATTTIFGFAGAYIIFGAFVVTLVLRRANAIESGAISIEDAMDSVDCGGDGGGD